MFKIVKSVLRAAVIGIATAAARVLTGKAQGAIEGFLQDELKKAAQYYVEVVTA